MTEDELAKLAQDASQSVMGFAAEPDPAVTLLKDLGFEHLEKRLWHRPGGIAAEVTVYGRIRLTIVRDGFSLQAGTFEVRRFRNALEVLLAAAAELAKPEPKGLEPLPGTRVQGGPFGHSEER